MLKLKELVHSRRLKEAEALLIDLLRQSPTDYALLMHLGGVSSSLDKYHAAEAHYKSAIAAHPAQCGSAQVQLMRLYAQQSRPKALLAVLARCLAADAKSISLKEQSVRVLLSMSEPAAALAYSRRLVEQLKAAQRTQVTQPNGNGKGAAAERARALCLPAKRSEVLLMHAQILARVGRFADAAFPRQLS